MWIQIKCNAWHAVGSVSSSVSNNTLVIQHGTAFGIRSYMFNMTEIWRSVTLMRNIHVVSLMKCVLTLAMQVSRAASLPDVPDRYVVRWMVWQEIYICKYSIIRTSAPHNDAACLMDCRILSRWHLNQSRGFPLWRKTDQLSYSISVLGNCPP